MGHTSLWEQLDSIRPDSDDLLDARMSEAVVELRDNPQVQREFETRQAWDRRIRDTQSAIIPPTNLVERLTARLNDATDEPVIVSAATRISRRRWLAWAASAAGLAATGTAIHLLRGQVEPVQLATVRDAGLQLLEGRSTPLPFDGSFEPLVPVDFRGAGVRVSDLRYGLLSDDEGVQRAAAIPFLVPAVSIEGLLLCVPAEWVSNPPGADSIFDRHPVYGGSTRTETLAWTSNSFVYLTLVRGSMDRLLDAMNTAPV